MKPCLVCGEPTDGPRCTEHAPSPVDHRPTSTARGYDQRWRRLSERARRLQPFCTDCGTTEDLTTDHSVEAWERKAAGLVIRLVDVEVVCRSCNARRGRARPLRPGEVPRLGGDADPRGEAEFRSHTRDTPLGAP